MKIAVLNTVLWLCLSLSLYAGNLSKTIADFGATSIKSAKENTPLIQSAIDYCAANKVKLVINNGDYKTGTLFLKSNLSLEIEEGSSLQGSIIETDYPAIAPQLRYGKDSLVKTLLFAENCRNIQLSGKGIINGNGTSESWREALKSGKQRPMIIRFIGCKNISVTDLKIINSANWVQQYVNCKNLIIRGITVASFANRNNDGIDIVSCSNVKISNCNVHTDDDAIVIKTLSELPARNISIKACTLRTNCNAFKIGTETLGNISRVSIENCILSGAEIESDIYKRAMALTGIAILSVDGAKVSRIKCGNLKISNTYAPLFIRLGSALRSYRGKRADSPGSISKILIENIEGESMRGPENIISGIPGHSIKSVELQNCVFNMPGGHLTKDLPVFEEKTTAYPEITMFGRVSPASGMYIRHAKVKLNNVKFSIAKPDNRPELVVHP